MSVRGVWGARGSHVLSRQAGVGRSRPSRGHRLWAPRGGASAGNGCCCPLRTNGNGEQRGKTLASLRSWGHDGLAPAHRRKGGGSGPGGLSEGVPGRDGEAGRPMAVPRAVRPRPGGAGKAVRRPELAGVIPLLPHTGACYQQQSSRGEPPLLRPAPVISGRASPLAAPVRPFFARAHRRVVPPAGFEPAVFPLRGGRVEPDYSTGAWIPAVGRGPDQVGPAKGLLVTFPG